MNLYLLRHAVAVDHERWHHKDSDRPLTPEGKKTMRQVAKGLKHLKLSLDHLWSSPYVRALDTAKILADGIKFSGKIELLSELSPLGNPREFISRLSRRGRSRQNVLLVGHEPYLSTLMSLLLGAESGRPFEFKKAGLCRLESDPGAKPVAWHLKWWIPPKLAKKF